MGEGYIDIRGVDIHMRKGYGRWMHGGKRSTRGWMYMGREKYSARGRIWERNIC